VVDFTVVLCIVEILISSSNVLVLLASLRVLHLVHPALFLLLSHEIYMLNISVANSLLDEMSNSE
jgi:hypothetical protein